eukprot:TRINITY_DN7776_c0_g2_i2.p1 TRINITY_DN7776_c0_g2~~TRINITY_DN7776_c0_g2_i2.p1  ORF type:complete len:480 (+),score=178.29 TRINITY_DN7776_c0_g2_i2:54-1493(+)
MMVVRAPRWPQLRRARWCGTAATPTAAPGAPPQVVDKGPPPTYKKVVVTPLFESRRRVLVLGTGWGGFNFLRGIDTQKYRVSCVSPANHFLFTPLLPSCAVGTLEFRAIQEPVRTIPNLDYYQAKAIGIDKENRVVRCRDIFKEHEFDVPYDYLVVTCGSKTSTFNTPGVIEREGRDILFLKHLHHARQVRMRILECFERAAMPSASHDERKRLLSFVVVGGGPTSCEFVGELYDFIVEDCTKWYPDLKTYTSVTLVEAGPALLGSFDQRLSQYVLGRFKTRNINVRLDVSVKSVEGNMALLSDDSVLPFGMMVWSAGLQPVKFANALDLPKGPTGRILTDETLKVKGEDSIYAFGDCAVMEDRPLPPIAQAAAQEGAYLSKVFNSTMLGPQSAKYPVAPFVYNSFGSMAMLGGWRAVADFSHVGSTGKTKDLGGITGRTAFLVWRAAYWGKQVSMINKILIPMYWLKAWMFGRDISRF